MPVRPVILPIVRRFFQEGTPCECPYDACDKPAVGIYYQAAVP